MPNHLVFPGGLCDPADFSLSWFKNYPEYKEFNVNKGAVFPDIFLNTSGTPSEVIPEIFPAYVG